MLKIDRNIDFHTKLMNESDIKIRVMSLDSFGKILQEGDVTDKALQEAYIIGRTMVSEVKYFRDLLSKNPNGRNVMEDFKRNSERINKLYGNKMDKLLSKIIVSVYDGEYGKDDICDAKVVEKFLEQAEFYKEEDLVWIAFRLGYTMEYIIMQEKLKKVYDN